ncbi:MAG: gluconate 2-dehydrogenase subunit 3 family protein [Gammaproteobacteria bacterium]|nr:gluconate 2-dehydrogenase subunit 3 family protein [Gammaproteobacteria bacterium]
MVSTNRRNLLRGAGLGLFSFTVAGVATWLTPREARARGAELQILTADEARLLEAIGEAFAPGATDAGIAWFIDQQLSVPANDSLLMARYFNVPPPFADFYRASMNALNGLSSARFDKPFTELMAAEAEGLLPALLGAEVEGWQGPPALLVYLVLRNDAVDVVYGTVEGIEALDIPYMAHILPPSKW